MESMENFPKKLRDRMGPLSRLWKGLEDFKLTDSEETVSVPIEEYVELVEHAVLPLGQAFNTIAIGRRDIFQNRL